MCRELMKDGIAIFNFKMTRRTWQRKREREKERERGEGEIR